MTCFVSESGEFLILVNFSLFFVSFFVMESNIYAPQSQSHSVAVEQTMRGLGGRSSAHAVTAASYPPVLKVCSSG